MSSGLLYTLLITSLALYAVLPVARLPRNVRPLAVIALVALSAIPFADASLAVIVRGAVGDLSVSTLFLLAVAASASIVDKPLVSDRARTGIVCFYSIAGLALYPAALGLGPWDPYRLGFGLALPALLLVLCASAVYLRQHIVALAIALVMGAHSLGLLESTNAWDYLLDPALWLYCLYAGLKEKRFSIRRQLPV